MYYFLNYISFDNTQKGSKVISTEFGVGFEVFSADVTKVILTITLINYEVKKDYSKNNFLVALILT